MSNLLKQRYVINLETEKRIINADDRFTSGGFAPLQADVYEAGDFSEDGELLDGEFMAGLSADEVPVEPQITPEELLEQAQAEANEILSVARAEAARIANDASRQAEILFEQKRQDGYNLGVSQIEQELEAKKMQLQSEYEDMEQRLQSEYESKLDTLEHDIVTVMIEVFEKVFHIQFENKKQILLHLIKDTLLGIDAGKNFTIRVSEENYKYIESHVTDIKEKVGNDVSIDVVNDMTMGEDACRIETATGVYSCGVDVVFDNLVKDIKSLCV